MSLEWMLAVIAEVYDQLPDDLDVEPGSPDCRLHPLRLEVEADELVHNQPTILDGWRVCEDRAHERTDLRPFFD